MGKSVVWFQLSVVLCSECCIEFGEYFGRFALKQDFVVNADHNWCCDHCNEFVVRGWKLSGYRQYYFEEDGLRI